MSLLSDIRAYADRTGTPVSVIGRAAVNDNGLFSRLTRGCTPMPATERRVRQLLAQHPQGLVTKPGRKCGERVEATIPVEARPAAVDRTPCPSCGTRGDLGCKHGRAGVNW